jgi:phospholipid/cholesterol/gamma-HCH transport system ATP-binding protein
MNFEGRNPLRSVYFYKIDRMHSFDIRHSSFDIRSFKPLNLEPLMGNLIMAKVIEGRRVILSFENVALDAATGRSEGVDVSFRLVGGELSLIRIQNRQQGTALADTGAGLIMPRQGKVNFLGKQWFELPPDTANGLRGRIGRIFSTGSWVGHLSVFDNLLLPQLHHTRRPAAELRDEAAILAENFDLPGLPMGHPEDTLPIDLQRAACIRAFMGQPVLILIEESNPGCFKEMMPNLINAIRNARDRGATVLWLTSDKFIWRDQSIPAGRRYRLAGRRFMEVRR